MFAAVVQAVADGAVGAAGFVFVVASGSVIAAFAVGVILPLLAAFDGTPVTSSEKTFCAYVTEDATYSLANVGEIAAWLVTWREGETVSATAMDGTAYTLAEDAASHGVYGLGRWGEWEHYNSDLVVELAMKLAERLEK